MKTKNHVIVTCKIHYTEQKYIAMIVSIIKTTENLDSKVNINLYSRANDKLKYSSLGARRLAEAYPRSKT